MAGDADVIAPAATIEQWWTTTVPSPKQLAVLGGVTHLGFMDLCTIAADQGGVFQVAERSGVAIPDVIAHLTADGCSPSHTPATTAWPAIRHLTIAQLRSALRHRPGPRRARRVAGRRLPRPHRPLPVGLTAGSADAQRQAAAGCAAGYRARPWDRRCPSTASRPRRCWPTSRSCGTVTSAGATGGP